MRALFVSSLLLVLTACPKKKEEPAPAPAPVREAEKKAITAAATQDAFWKWFQANEARLADRAMKRAGNPEMCIRDSCTSAPAASSARTIHPPAIRRR